MNGVIRRGSFWVGLALAMSVAWAGTTTAVQAQVFEIGRAHV